MSECTNPECGGQGLYDDAELQQNTCPVCGEKFETERIYCDGSGWNGYLAATCVWEDRKRVQYEEFIQQQLTNNEAEYKALARAILIASPRAIIYTDSQLVQRQVLGMYQVREPRLKAYHDIVIDLLRQKQVEIRWIQRNQNKAGKYIEKRQKRRNYEYNSSNRIN